MSCVLLTVEKDSLPLGMVGTSSSASAASFKILLTNALIEKQFCGEYIVRLSDQSSVPRKQAEEWLIVQPMHISLSFDSSCMSRPNIYTVLRSKGYLLTD